MTNPFEVPAGVALGYDEQDPQPTKEVLVKKRFCRNCDGVGAKQYEDGMWCSCPVCLGKGVLNDTDN